LRSRLADYQILGPGGPDADSFLATPPVRLGAGDAPVVLIELASSREDWASVSERLASLAGVRSPFLARLIEAGQADEEDGAVTWVAREDGRARPVTGAAPDQRDALQRLAAAARGAHDLHEAGIVHGDIRSRALLERNGTTVLEPPVRGPATTGLGAQPVDLDTLEPASIWGEGPSRAGDIWALGATAHRVLSGTYLHPGLQQDLIVTAVQRVLVEPPAMAATLPAGVVELLRACVAPDPADRPATAADLADAFERLATTR
jgi:hypothetical protein